MGKIKYFKEKIVGYFSSTSGLLGLAGAHNVCHTLCTAVIAFLALFGITVVGMPLAFLQDYNIYFWGMALSSLLIGIPLYLKNRKCMSWHMIAINGGIVIASIPFTEVQQFNTIFLAIGGIIITITIISYFMNKLLNNR